MPIEVFEFVQVKPAPLGDETNVVGVIVEDGKNLRGVEDGAEGARDRLELRLVDDLFGELDRILDRPSGADVGIVGGEAGVAVLVEADAIAADAGGDHEA